MTRSIVLLLLGLLPASRPKNRLLTLCGRGWSVAATARIHPTVLWRVGRLHAGERCHIGPGNVLRQLARVELADEASIGQFNWITAEASYAEQADPALAGCLLLDFGAAIASRHYLDCAGGVTMGSMSILAGVRSTFLTHWADHAQWVLRAAPIRIGDSVIVSSVATVTAGAAVAERSIVAAGAVVPKALTEPARLYAGVPAKPVADLTGAAHANRSAPRFARPGSEGDTRAATR